MSTLVNCPKCKIDIEDDSFFCDQCGTELFICPTCRVFGKGKRCTQCGQPLIAAKEVAEAEVAGVSTTEKQTSTAGQPASFGATSAPVTVDSEPAKSAAPPVSSPDKTIRPGVVAPEPARLICSAHRLRLGLGNGAVIGRRKGDYVTAFAPHPYVSSSHARLQKNTSGKWEIVDLDSTNGTFVNGKRLSPNVPVVFNIGDVIGIATLQFKVQ